MVLSGAHTTDRKSWEPLRVTCERANVPLEMYGLDNPLNYASNDPRLFDETVGESMDAIKASEAEYVVLTDSFDVIVNRWDQRELVDIIDLAGGMVVSCEANCFPPGPWKQVYDNAPHLITSPWRYANGGQFCGTKEKILDLLNILRVRMCEATTGGANEILHKLFVEGYPLSLDSDCEIFQSMYLDVSSHVKNIFGKAFNDLTNTWPMFLHFNGRAKTMPDWYKRLTGMDYPRNSARPEYGGC